MNNPNYFVQTRNQKTQKKLNKQDIVSITYEELGFYPQSLRQVKDRFLQQIFSDVDHLIMDQYNFYRYLLLTTLKSILIVVCVPFLVNFFAKNYVVRPLTQYLWNSKQTEVFLNTSQKKRAFLKLKEFEDKLYFESLVFEDTLLNDLPDDLSTVRKEDKKIQTEKLKSDHFDGIQNFRLNTGKACVSKCESVLSGLKENSNTNFNTSVAYIKKPTNVYDNYHLILNLKEKNFLKSLNLKPARRQTFQPFQKLLFGFLPDQKNSLEFAPSIAGGGNIYKYSYPSKKNKKINSIFMRDFSLNGNLKFSSFKKLAVERLNLQLNCKIKTQFIKPQFSNPIINIYVKNYTFYVKLYDKNFLDQIKPTSLILQEKSIELATQYNVVSIEAITNLCSDLISFFTLCYLIFTFEIQINITKSFLLEVFFGFNATKKSLLILSVTDLLVGYHSSNIWEESLKFLLNHYGFADNKVLVLLLVATLPVFLDVLFKYLIFRHLNRASPGTVATYYTMIE